MTLDEADHARGWLTKAEHDIAGIHSFLKTDGPSDVACFLAQQAAEKFLKAVLAASDRPIVRTHVLLTLYRLVVELHPEFVADESELAALTPYAVDLRYDLKFLPDQSVAREALAMAERVRRAVLDVLPPGIHPVDEGEAS